MTTTKKHRLLLVLVLMFAILQIAIAQEDCTIKKDKDGITVYSCKTDSSNLNLLRAEFDLYSSIDQYLQLVRNVDNYKNWHFRTIDPRELSRENENSIIYYTQMSAPWPVSDRDLIVQLKINIEKDGSMRAILKSLPNHLPESEDFVRIPYSHSEMHMVPIAENHLKVSYWLRVDPGGSIPDWLANMVSAQGPYETFKKMKSLLESTSSTLPIEHPNNKVGGQQ